jgi:hypothetical protein
LNASLYLKTIPDSLLSLISILQAIVASKNSLYLRVRIVAVHPLLDKQNILEVWEIAFICPCKLLVVKDQVEGPSLAPGWSKIS